MLQFLAAQTVKSCWKRERGTRRADMEQPTHEEADAKEDGQRSLASLSVPCVG